MARAKQVKGVSTPTKSNKEARAMDAKYSPKKQDAQRVKKYKQAKRAKQAQALENAIKAAESPATKKALAGLEGRIYQPWKFRSKGAGKVAQLEELVRQQQEEIQELRKMLQGKSVPMLEPVSPKVVGVGVEGPDSSPVKIREQLMNDVALSNEEGEAQDELAGVLEVEEVMETTEGAEPE